MKDWTRSYNQIVGRFISLLFVLIGLTVAAGCAGTPDLPPKTIYESGRNQVRLEKDPESSSNTHPQISRLQKSAHCCEVFVLGNGATSFTD